MKKILLGLSAILTSVSLASCASTPSSDKPANTAPTDQNTSSVPSAQNSAPSATENISISGFAFATPSLTVKQGTTVTWTNQDSVSHNVIGDNGGPASALLPQGSSYSYTFNTVGTFSYHCSIHPMMKGVVVVTP